MKMQVMSDLHTEKYVNPLSFLTKLKFEPDLDFLILAGDTTTVALQSLETLFGVYQFLSSKARWVVCITGNHEYYGSTKAHVETTLRIVTKDLTNLVWLFNEEVTLDGKHFIGGAMWFPFPKPWDDQLRFKEIVSQGWSDYVEIKDLPHWVHDDNAKFTQVVTDKAGKDSIIISHHIPNMRCMNEKWWQAPTNYFFVSDQAQNICTKEPRVWIHGHTHEKKIHRWFQTLIICNPHGYPAQNPLYNYPPVVVQI
jgi:predicted phosphodiesterase